MPSGVLLVAQPSALLLGTLHGLSYPRAGGGFEDFEDPDPALNTPDPNIQKNVCVEEGI